MRDSARREEIRRDARELAGALAHALARARGDSLAIQDLFRTAHTLKGLAELLEEAAAARIVDAIEDALDDLRHGRIALLPALREALLHGAERCRASLDGEAAEVDATIAWLQALRAEAVRGTGDDRIATIDLPAFVREALTDYERARLRENLRLGRHLHLVRAGFSLAEFDAGLEEIHRRVVVDGEPIATLPARTEAEISFEILVGSALDAAALERRLAELPVAVAPVARFAAAPAATADATSSEPLPRGRVDAEANDAVEGAAAPVPVASPTSSEPPRRVRVDAQAIRAVGRAAAAVAAEVAQLGTDAAAPLAKAVRDLLEAAHRLGHVAAAELVARAEETVAAAARAWGRKVRLEPEGAGIDLPVAIAEPLAEALLHLVRNAIDHGIEAPAERLRRGKPVEGTIRLAFRRTADAIVVELSDDGAGIDERRLAEAARALGHSEERLAALSREARLALVFEPGLSTAAKQGRSGRGVGLDAVRTAIARCGGTIAVASTPGAGTTVTLRLPVRA